MGNDKNGGGCTVYIAGPMTGIAGFNRLEFHAAADRLRARGWCVLDPAVLPTDLPQECYMPICLAMLQQCGAIYLLRGWEQSRGAQIEKRYAEYNGYAIMEEADEA